MPSTRPTSAGLIDLIDTDGRIAYAGGGGPFFFSVEEMVSAIEALLP